MRRQRQNYHKWLILGLSLTWIALAGWYEISAIKRASAFSAAYGGCSGSFTKRANCATGNMLANDRRTFMQWTGKLAIVIGPPIALYGFTNMRARSRHRARGRSRHQSA